MLQRNKWGVKAACLILGRSGVLLRVLLRGGRLESSELGVGKSSEGGIRKASSGGCLIGGADGRGVVALVLLSGSGGGGSSLLLGLLLSLELSGVAVEEEIHGHVPGERAGDGSAKAEDLASEHPEEKSNGVLALVVGGDGNINVLEWGVSVAEGDGGDADVRGFSYSLRVRPGVADEKEAGLLELAGLRVGEGTGRPALVERLSASVLRVLENGALAVGARGHGENVSGVLDGDNDASSELDLLKSLAHVENVHTIVAAAPDVGGSSESRCCAFRCAPAQKAGAGYPARGP